jgi:transposase-like protein
MKTYPDEMKSSVITRLLPPNNEHVPKVSIETGIPKDALYAWRIKHRRSGKSVELSGGKTGSLSSDQKFDIVLETAGMNQAELSEYCRKKGLYPQQIDTWRETCRTLSFIRSMDDEWMRMRGFTQGLVKLNPR